MLHTVHRWLHTVHCTLYTVVWVKVDGVQKSEMNVLLNVKIVDLMQGTGAS